MTTASDGRTVQDLFDAMAAATTPEQMRAVFDDEVAFQRTGHDPDPKAVALHNMKHVAGYGSQETAQRILGLIRAAL